MKYAFLVWSALRRKPVRTILTSLSIFAAFFLFGVLQGINVGMGKLMASAQADHLLVMSRVNMGTPLPRAHEARIAALPGVKQAVGLMMMPATWQGPRNAVLAMGTDIEALFRMYAKIMWAPADQIAAARRLRSGVIVGRKLAERYHWKIGDRIPLKALVARKADGTSDWVFDVVGIYDRDQPETAMWVVANYDYLNEARVTGKDTLFEIVVSAREPARITQLAQTIDEQFANTPNQTLTQTERDYIESMVRQLGDVNFLVNGIVVAVLFALLFLTANTMAQSVRERLSELAVLKAIGFTDTAVQWLVLVEATVLCLFAAGLGLIAATAILPVVTNLPGLGLAAMHVPTSVFLWGTGVALLVALISGGPLARKARRLDIASALAGR